MITNVSYLKKYKNLNKDIGNYRNEIKKITNFFQLDKTNNHLEIIDGLKKFSLHYILKDLYRLANKEPYDRLLFFVIKYHISFKLTKLLIKIKQEKEYKEFIENLIRCYSLADVIQLLLANCLYQNLDSAQRSLLLEIINYVLETRFHEILNLKIQKTLI